MGVVYPYLTVCIPEYTTHPNFPIFGALLNRIYSAIGIYGAVSLVQENNGGHVYSGQFNANTILLSKLGLRPVH